MPSSLLACMTEISVGVWHFVEHVAEVFGVDDSVAIDGEIGDVDAARGQRLARVEHGFVFDYGADQICAGVIGGVEDAEDGVIVGFGSAAGEDNFLGLRADESGDLFAGGFDGGAGFLAGGVDGGGVAEVSGEEGEHGFEDCGVDRSGGVVVEVDARLHGG